MISEITFNEKILFVCKQYMQNRKFESDFVFLETFITELNELTLVKLDFFRVVFLTEEGGGGLMSPSLHISRRTYLI